MIWPEIWPWVLWAVLVIHYRSRIDVRSANEHGSLCICFDCELPFSNWTHTWVRIQ